MVSKFSNKRTDVHLKHLTLFCGFDCPESQENTSLLRCCHISPDSVNGRRTDRKSTKNVYPVVKVVSVAMKVVAECVRSA